ncbi:MAG: hypothetical protein DRQ59_00225 [Gammaproteobacteria bacterium]|nr:MAG: hypothetical protein DRQ59_00225 [Gammaproteobacteria bacterium]
MLLESSPPRKKMHHRRVDCEGYLRDDALWDIEAHMTDTRTYDCAYDEFHRGGMIKAGEPVHEMRLCLTIDLDFKIHDARASSDHTPFAICSQAAGEIKTLIGLRIGRGWMKQVRERIPIRNSCTHLIDLLGPIAATAYQTLHAALEEREAKQPSRRKPPILDTCLALDSGGEVVKNRWPEFYTPSQNNETQS